MTGWTVEPLTPANADRAAAYLAARDGSDAAALEAQIRWRVFDNPALPPGVEPGHLLAADDGRVAGVNLGIAQRFVFGRRAFVGLCSSAFYVDPAARLQGFLMFRRLLAQPHVDFWFATTCNAESAALWERIGGTPAAASRVETIVPLSAAIRPMHAVFGRRLRFEDTADWDALASLAALLTPADAFTAARDAAFLQWRYGHGAAERRHRLWRVSALSGECGWIAVTQFGRRTALRLRSWVVTDLIWPDPASARDVVMGAAAKLDREGDLLAVRGSAARPFGLLPELAYRREFRHVPAWVKGDASLPAGMAHLVPADGDTAP